MKNSQKGFIVRALLIIIAVLVVGGGLYYLKTKPSYNNNLVQNDGANYNPVQDGDLVQLSHSSRGYSWTTRHPRRYKYLTNINVDGPFIDMSINDTNTCQVSVTAPAREKDLIAKLGLDTVYNRFIDDQKKGLQALEKVGFISERPKNVIYTNLFGVMFEYKSARPESSTIAGSHSTTYIMKYIDKDMIAAFTLQCNPAPIDIKLLSQYQNELVGIITSFE